MKKSPREIVAIIDTREKLEVSFRKLKTVRRGLKTGDYSVVGLEQSYLTVERKGLDDFVNCVGNSRRRFDDNIERLLKFKVKAIVVEGTMDDLIRGRYTSKVHPNAVIGSFVKWQMRGIPIILAGAHSHYIIEYFLAKAATDRFLELEQEKLNTEPF